jgi:hypothetical protein
MMSILVALSLYLYVVGALASLAGVAVLRVDIPDEERRQRFLRYLVLYAALWPVLAPYTFATMKFDGDE